jgi:hypothetical protein
VLNRHSELFLGSWEGDVSAIVEILDDKKWIVMRLIGRFAKVKKCLR